jgi:uncharacterized membrane protein YfcA
MEYLVICLVALVVSALTLFSGFGLGTVLMPAFAIFFPVGLAVAGTAVVHLANNLFKLILVGKHANTGIVVRFAIPAAVCAAIGALLLGQLSGVESIARYQVVGITCEVTVVKIVIAILIAVFSMLDLLPQFERLAFDPKYIGVGGALSGFFGGLSGLQGALRSAFLVRCGLDKEAFIGTAVVSAVVVDIARVFIYGTTFVSKHFRSLKDGDFAWLVIAGMVSAFVGSFVGARLVAKVTIKVVRLLVGSMLLLLSVALGMGLV